MTDRANELAVAVAAVRAASLVCRAVQADLVTAATLAKKDRSPVTVADFASQAVVCRALREAFGEDPIVGEEDAAELRAEGAEEVRRKVLENVRRVLPGASEAQALDWIDLGTTGQGGSEGRFWTLDPIDGTKGFLRGEQYAVALALIEEGRVVLGVLGCPNLADPELGEGTLCYALEGGGAFWLPIEGEGLEGALPLRADGIEDPAQAVICESVESGHTDQSQSSVIAARLGVAVDPLRIDSQCKYAAVARGDASIYLRLPTRPGYQEKIWDHAAGWLIAREAGGKVTDVEGAELDFGQGRTLANNRGVICTNGALHERVLEAVGAVLG